MGMESAEREESQHTGHLPFYRPKSKITWKCAPGVRRAERGFRDSRPVRTAGNRPGHADRGDFTAFAAAMKHGMEGERPIPRKARPAGGLSATLEALLATAETETPGRRRDPGSESFVEGAK